MKEYNTALELNVIEDPFTACNKLPDCKLIFMSQNHTYPIAAWWKKMLHVQNSNPIILGNKVKFSSFYVIWSKTLCCDPFFLEVASQNYHATKTGQLLTAKPNQASRLHFLTYWWGSSVIFINHCSQYYKKGPHRFTHDMTFQTFAKCAKSINMW